MAARAPGARPALGFATAYLGLVVLLPLSALVARGAALPAERWVALLTSPRVVAAFGLSLGAAAVAALVSGALGLLLAWVLVRHDFPGRRLIDAIVDLPFALPTAVAGIAMTTLYAPDGWLGAPLARLGLKVAFTRVGLVIALIFIGVPFVVRTLQPVLEDLGREGEEAAAMLGATPVQAFVRVVVPSLRPAWITGVTLAFARAIGEYGSVVFISGNMPMRTEIAPLLIMTKLEEYDYAGAAVLATALLALSFVLLVALGTRRARSGHA